MKYLKELFNNKIMIIAICIIVVVFILLFINKGNSKFEENLITYISNKDYIIDTGKLYKNKSNNIYFCNENSTNDCETTDRYFNISTYEYFISKRIREANVYIELIPSYDYKTNEIRYNYRTTYKNGTVMYMGTYNEKSDKFTCDLDYSYGIDANKDTVCSYIKNEVINFNKEAKLFITDSYLLDNFRTK